ncbi:MAG: triphosphoribosyl-dephospho-CoA synthase [Gemmatimonadales bacterium]|nr:triphosphoribosyl-dephospho-CoA synthase [Gemmatimonadales bacterium]
MSDDAIGAAAQLACLLEASAPKPGNVSPGRDFGDTTYADFLASAAAIGPAMARAGDVPLGETILAAVRATRRWTRANTNLGIILLLAPLARAAALGGPLRGRLREVLATTTVRDAAQAYEAIRLARPGGLGRAAVQDVEAAPTVSLREAMVLAASRDAIAAEWATDFALTFDTGAPALRAARRDGLAWDDAVVEAFLALLAEAPDSLIARKLGRAAAAEVSAEAAAALALGGIRTPLGRGAIATLDAALRSPDNRRNPGTSADLTAAALLVVILERDSAA